MALVPTTSDDNDGARKQGTRIIANGGYSPIQAIRHSVSGSGHIVFVFDIINIIS